VDVTPSCKIVLREWLSVKLQDADLLCELRDAGKWFFRLPELEDLCAGQRWRAAALTQWDGIDERGRRAFFGSLAEGSH
jgi:hypothetical protein